MKKTSFLTILAFLYKKCFVLLQCGNAPYIIIITNKRHIDYGKSI